MTLNDDTRPPQHHSSPTHSHSIVSSLKERIHLYEVIYLIKLRKKYLYFFTGVTVFGTILSHFLYIPAYTAQARLEVLGQRENMLTRMAAGDSPAILTYGSD